MGEPTMRQLRSWHRRLTTAHSKAVGVAREAEAVMTEPTIIMDPIIELHAALCCIEGLIDERKARSPTP